MERELMQADMRRKLKWIEDTFGPKPERVQPKISREATILFIKDNLRYLRFASPRELAEIAAIISAIKAPQKGTNENI